MCAGRRALTEHDSLILRPEELGRAREERGCSTGCATYLYIRHNGETVFSGRNHVARPLAISCVDLTVRHTEVDEGTGRQVQPLCRDCFACPHVAPPPRQGEGCQAMSKTSCFFCAPNNSDCSHLHSTTVIGSFRSLRENGANDWAPNIQPGLGLQVASLSTQGREGSHTNTWLSRTQRLA